MAYQDLLALPEMYFRGGPQPQHYVLIVDNRIYLQTSWRGGNLLPSASQETKPAHVASALPAGCWLCGPCRHRPTEPGEQNGSPEMNFCQVQ